MTQDADVVKNVAKDFCSWIDLDFINQLYALPFDDSLCCQITLATPSTIGNEDTEVVTTHQKAQWLVKAELLEVGKFPVIIGQDNEVKLPVMDLYWLTERYLTLIICQYQTYNLLQEDDKP